MHRRLHVWAPIFLLQYKGVLGRPINATSAISATPTISTYDSRQQQSHTAGSSDFSTFLQSASEHPKTLSLATSMPMPRPISVEGTPSPTHDELKTIAPVDNDVHLMSTTNSFPPRKVFDEKIQSPLFRESLKWTAPLFALSAILASGWYAQPKEPASLWTIANIVTAAAILPFHDQTISDIIGNVVKGAAVSFNVLHYQATIGSGPRPVIGLVTTIVVYFLLYSQRSKVIGDGPEDLGLRVVAPWLCAPLAIVIVSELSTLLKRLLAICRAIAGSLSGAISAR